MKYQVYGIGNALVDAEYEVSDDFLAQQNIEKGMMTLIDDQQQDALVSALSKAYTLKKRAGGGSAANTTVAISQLGGKTFYACKVANDESGDFYTKDLAKAGVTTKTDAIKQEGITGKCFVMVTEDAERTMNTFLGITSDFAVSDLDQEGLQNSEYIYVEGYLVTSDVSRQAVIHARQVAKEHGVKTAFTFSDPAMVTYFKDGVTEVIGDGVDVLFSNEEEALTYTGKDNLNEAIEELLKVTQKLVITLGSQGARVVTANSDVSIAPHKVKAIDTNGAGDMFAGAFMYGLTHDMSDEQAGKLASEAAANIITVFGARLEQQTLLDIKAKHQA